MSALESPAIPRRKLAVQHKCTFFRRDQTMFSSLHRKSGAVSTKVNGPAARRPRRSQPALESL
jgi:hypothetical protein